MIGQRFGMLTVVEQAQSRNRRRYWKCKCDCGGDSIALATNLRTGHTQSCGCQERKATHGHTVEGKSSNTFNIWAAMIQRCTNPNNKRFKHYGGRGISICDRWKTFENFLADMGEKPDGLSLDRINNHGDYSPENCRWATASEQCKNRRSKREMRVYNENEELKRRIAELTSALEKARDALTNRDPYKAKELSNEAIATINGVLK